MGDDRPPRYIDPDGTIASYVWSKGGVELAAGESRRITFVLAAGHLLPLALLQFVVTAALVVGGVL
jgi:hypothetical protein